MSIRKFVAPFLFIVLLGSPIMLLPNQAAALPFCGCGYCYMAALGKCTCAYPYHYCLNDPDPLQFTTSTDNHLTDTSSIPEGLTSTIAKPDVAERVLDLMSGGKCFRDRVVLSLHGSKGLKFVPMQFDEKNLLAL